jgi:hypothetical protein
MGGGFAVAGQHHHGAAARLQARDSLGRAGPHLVLEGKAAQHGAVFLREVGHGGGTWGVRRGDAVGRHERRRPQ